jgi:hypothetical protein
MVTSKELYDLLRNAEYDAHPSWRHLTTTCWVMNLEWYKAIRRAFLPSDADDEDKDESKWEPQHGDMVLGYNITVTGDGGQPHLVDGRPAELRALIRRHDPKMAG